MAIIAFVVITMIIGSIIASIAFRCIISAFFAKQKRSIKIYFTKLNRMQHTPHYCHYQNIHQSKGIRDRHHQNDNIDEHLNCRFHSHHHHCDRKSSYRKLKFIIKTKNNGNHSICGHHYDNRFHHSKHSISLHNLGILC